MALPAGYAKGMMRRTYLLTALALLVAAGCGGSSTPSPSPAPTTSVAPTATASGAPGAQLWVQRYRVGTEAPDTAESVAVSPDGSAVYITGTSGTLAYRAGTGARLWLTTSTAFAGSGGSTSPPTLAVSPDGARVFVAGTSGRGPGGGDYATYAYDAKTGKQLWTKTYNGPGNRGDDARSVAVSPDSRTVFVNGTSDGVASGADFATLAYDAATGTQRWVARYNGPGNGPEMLFPADTPQSLAVSSDGTKIFVTGGSTGKPSGLDYATVAYNASSGAQLWASRYSGPRGGDDSATAVTVTPDSATVLTTGFSGGTGNADFATVAYDATTGAQRWASRYDGPAHQNDGAVSVAIDPSGKTVFVTGTSEGPTLGKEDMATLAYNAGTGAQLWVTRFDGPAKSDDNATAVAVSRDGAKVYVTGWSNGATSGHDIATTSYDATSGARLWTARYTATEQGNDEPRSLAVSPTGTVFVVGGSAGGYVTLAYGG